LRGTPRAPLRPVAGDPIWSDKPGFAERLALSLKTLDRIFCSKQELSFLQRFMAVTLPRGDAARQNSCKESWTGNRPVGSR